MNLSRARLKRAVAAFFAVMLFAPQTFADSERVDQLFEALQTADDSKARAIEREIWAEWAQSGSDAMDLLLQRGRDAMEAGNWDAALEHISALTDHAPEFAEGWNMRATIFFNMGKFGLSLADIQKTLALNPRHFGAISGLAMIMEETGRLDLALEAYLKLQAIHPRWPYLKDNIDRLKTAVNGVDI